MSPAFPLISLARLYRFPLFASALASVRQHASVPAIAVLWNQGERP